MIVLLLSFLFLIPSFSVGMIGYNCGSGELNVTTISLLEVGQCDVPNINLNITYPYIQLLQISEYSEVMVRQCKVEVRRTIYRCGMFSHISVVHNGVNEYIMETNKVECESAHITGILKLPNSHVISGLRINETITHPITIAGSLENDGSCQGTGYSDPYGSWKKVVVQATVKITLLEHLARVKLESNTIVLKSGTNCRLAEEKCVDQEGGYTYWNTVQPHSCKFDQYSILYEGRANKMVDHDIYNPQTIYTVNKGEVTFALNTKSSEYICGYLILKTEHPKLFIFETQLGTSFVKNTKIAISNLDLFAYVNSKFIYVEKHIRKQMKQLYVDIVSQKCYLEQQTIKNSLSLATQAPDQFAFDIMKGPGYMALVSGESIHIIKCTPMEVKIQQGENCYNELQVTANNKTFFLSPRTHVLKTRGTQIQCNSLLPSYYLVNEHWYKILPQVVEALPPAVIQPSKPNTWKYINPEDLATSGIYTEKEIDQLNDKIMFPVEKTAVLNNLAMSMSGHQIISTNDNVLNLFNEQVVEKFVNNTWNKMWDKFMVFGTASAGVFAIFTIFHLLKSVVNTLVHGYTLHSIYGWSIHLLGAICGSVAHLLVHLGTRPPQPEDVPLQEVTSQETKEVPAAEAPPSQQLYPSNELQQQRGYFNLNT